MQERRLYAAFAGINAYPDSPLSGCIQDVLRVDRLLRSQCAAQEGLAYHPVYYLQPNNADLRLLEQYGTAAGAPLTWLPPTFENFTTRLFTHFSAAKAGDICVQRGRSSCHVAAIDVAVIDRFEQLIRAFACRHR